MQAQEEVLMIKGKRSKRPRPPSPLSLTIATTSSELSSGGGVVSDIVSGSSYRVTPSPSNSGEVTADEEEEDMANCLILLAKGQRSSPPVAAAAAAEAYQCKTCNRSFLSFQALGGHRASHKKPNKPEDQKKPLMKQEAPLQSSRDHSTILSLQISNRSKSRVHECSICGAEFGSGQALGGHMRRHRPIPAAAASEKKPRNVLSLDLNLPAPEDDHSESKFPFSAKEQVIVFSASPLIDCRHY